MYFSFQLGINRFVLDLALLSLTTTTLCTPQFPDCRVFDLLLRQRATFHFDAVCLIIIEVLKCLFEIHFTAKTLLGSKKSIKCAFRKVTESELPPRDHKTLLSSTRSSHSVLSDQTQTELIVLYSVHIP